MNEPAGAGGIVPPTVIAAALLYRDHTPNPAAALPSLFSAARSLGCTLPAADLSEAISLALGLLQHSQSWLEGAAEVAATLVKTPVKRAVRAAPKIPPKATPLWLCIRRLAPFVAASLITHSEALDTVMSIAVERWWERYQHSLPALEEWTSRALAREAEKCRLAQRPAHRPAIQAKAP